MNSADYKRLVATGMTSEQIAVVIEMFDERDEARKADQRARWRKHQENKRNANVSQREPTLANVPREGVTRVEDKTSNSEIEPQEKKETRASALVAFEAWYRVYPHKVQRGQAERAFPKALALAGSVEALIAGVQRYVATKPPDRAWRNPASWLNGKGWLDEPAAVVPMARGSPASGLNMSHLYATQERMERERDQQPELAETSVRYLPAANG